MNPRLPDANKEKGASRPFTGRDAQCSLPCPLCATPSPAHVLAYHRCPACTHQFLDFSPPEDHTEQQYGDDYFTGGGDGYADYLAERDLLIARGKFYAKKLARRTGGSSGELLDVGSAAGFVAKGFQQQGWSVTGVEPGAAMAAHANEQEGVPTVCSSVEGFETEKRFDVVTLIQVIAHLEDPAAILGRAKSLLKPGGHLLVETWDSGSITARALKKRWHEYNPPSVLHAFTRRSLLRLAEARGFDLVAGRRTVKSIQAAHGKAVLEHKFGGSRAFGWLGRPLLRLLPGGLRVPYPADDLFWMCFRAKD